MSSRTGRGRVVTLAAVGLGLVGAGSAWANAGTYSILTYPGLWVWVVMAVIVAIEGAVLHWLGRFPWLAALVTIALANVFTMIIGAGMARGGDYLKLQSIAYLTGVNIIFELPAVLVARGLLRGRAERRGRPLAAVEWAALAVIVMNLASAPVVPVFQRFLPNERMFAAENRCLRNLKLLSLALDEYRAQHGGWPPARNLRELESLLEPNTEARGAFQCPGGTQGRRFPLPLPPTAYGCADFTRLPPSPENAGTVPIIWDPAPRHGGRYDVLWADGHVGSTPVLDQWRAGVPAKGTP